MGEVVGFSGRFVKPSARRFASEATEFDRGLILGIPYHVDTRTNTVASFNAHFDPGELRRAALFWDKCVIPNSGVVPLCLDADAAFLVDAGHLQVLNFPSSGNVASVVTQSYADCFTTLEARQPGCWSMSASNASLELRRLAMNEQRGAEVQLVNAVPIPENDAPLEDVLEFRCKRHDELRRLRSAIDGYFDRWLVSADRVRSLSLASKEIELSCLDLIKASGEAGFRSRIARLTVGFGLTGMCLYTLKDFIASGSWDPSLLNFTTLAGATASGIAIGLSSAPELSTNRAAPFRYAASIHHHFGRQA